MSSCPTGPTSTTASSTSWPSPAELPPSGLDDHQTHTPHLPHGPHAPLALAPHGPHAPQPPAPHGPHALPPPQAPAPHTPHEPRVSHRHQENQADQQSQAVQAVVIACGALGGPIRDIAARRGWPIELHCLPALLHSRPAAIAPQVERLAVAAQARSLPVAVGYADCGTYGALDELSARLRLRRAPGLHCYDLLAGPDRVAALFEAEPGTYVLTDFLVRSFRRTVLAGLGLDRYPELWPDYFGHYRRLVWLAQARDPALEAEAEAVAAQFGLPLTVIDTGLSRLERELEHLLAGVAPGTPSSCAQTAVAPVPPQDQPRPCAETAVMTTVSAHAIQPLAPGHSAPPGMGG